MFAVRTDRTAKGTGIEASFVSHDRSDGDGGVGRSDLQQTDLGTTVASRDSDGSHRSGRSGTAGTCDK